MGDTIKGGLAFADPAKINPYGAKEEDLSEYQQSLQDSVNALQMRYAQPNWFNVAAGFLKPQLGGFAASLGSASQAMGENLEKQRESQLPIAQMRSQLAMSKIAMGQNKSVADMEKERLRVGDPLTPQYVSKLVNIAPDSPQAKAAQAELATMQKNRELESSEISSRATQYGQALQEINLNVANHIYKTPQEYQAALAAAKAAYGPKEPSVVRPPNTNVIDKGGAGSTGAVQPPEAAVQPPAAGAVQPPAVAVAPKIMGAQDFITKSIYQDESPDGKPNPNSTAVGRGQMTKDTREYIYKKYHMNAKPEEYATNPEVAASYDYANLADNHVALKDPTAFNHRVLWWFGQGDGPKILNAKDDAKLGSLGLSLKENKEEPLKDQYKINRLSPDTTVGDLKDQIRSQLQKRGIDPNTRIAFDQQSATEAAPVAVEKQPTKISWSDKSYPVPKPVVPEDLDINAKNKYLETNVKNSTEFVNNLAAMANDSSTINRRTNLLKTAELVQDPLVQAWIARNSPTSVSKTIRDALASDSMPAFVQSITRGTHGLLPTDSPKMVSQVQKYVQNLAQEQQYANQMQAASTNKQLQLEQFSAVNPEMQPKAAMQKIAEELHKIQRLSTMPYLLEPYAASGHTIASMLNSDRVNDYNNHWSALHQALPAFANGNFSNGRPELPLALTHPDAYKPGFNYESLKPKGKQ
jgi:hypothetical protein